MRIIPHESRLEDMQNAVDQLLKGWHWCSACGEVKIDPELVTHCCRAFKCRECYKKWKDSEDQGEIKIVQKEGYQPSSVRPNTKRVRPSSEGLTKYCTKCGDEIDERRLSFAIFISAGKREASQCAACAKGYKRPLNETAMKKDWIFVPDSWLSFAEHICPSFQTSLL